MGIPIQEYQENRTGMAMALEHAAYYYYYVTSCQTFGFVAELRRQCQDNQFLLVRPTRIGQIRGGKANWIARLFE